MEIADSGRNLNTPASDALPGQSAPKPGAKNRRRVLIAALITILLIAFLCAIGVLGGNVRAIQAGRAYRSSTLTGINYTGISARLAGNDLASVIRRDHIQTVICLRSGSPKDDWYREELAVCSTANIEHKDIPFSARSLPPPSAMASLLDTFDRAKYPILLHCQAGADRTGLASAIYAHLYAKLPLANAEAEELTWRYGHFPVDKTRAMDEFFDLYRRDSRGTDLRTWILKRYPEVYAEKTSGAAMAR